MSAAILRDVPAPVENLRGDLPRDLDRIIGRCLEKNPQDRFQTARDVYNGSARTLSVRRNGLPEDHGLLDLKPTHPLV